MAIWNNWVKRLFGKGETRQQIKRRTPRRQLAVEGLEERLVLYTTFGGAWPQPGGLGNPVNVSYSYRNLFDGGIQGVSNYNMLQAVEEVLSLWARYAPFTFREVTSGSITWGHGPQSGSTLAVATSPQGGDVTFDDSSRTWSTSLFLETAAHELGHSLGLGHSTFRSAPVDQTGPVNEPILNPSIQGLYTGLGTAFLYQDDVNGIRARYGSGVGEVISIRNWLSTANGNWDTDASWSRAFEPTINSDVGIEDGRTVSITGSTRRARTVTLGNTDGESATLSITGGSLTVRKNIRIGGNGTGTLTITAGSVTTAGLNFGGNASTDQEQVTVNGGSLILTAAITDGTGTSTLTIGSGTLDLNNNTLTVDRFLFNGGTLTDTNGAVTIKSLLQLRGVTLSIPNITLQGGFTLDPAATGAATVNSNINLGGGTRTFTLADTNPSGSDVFFNGVLSNGGLTKAGPGTLKLVGANTYTGATSVNAGELFVTGSMTSPVTLAGGARLRGNGQISGNVTNNGILAPGADLGTLNVGGATLGTNGTLAIELGAGVSDRLAVTGAATLGGILAVSLAPGYTPQVGNTFTILTAGSITGSFRQFTGFTLGNGLVLRIITSATAVTLTVVANSAPVLDASGVFTLTSINRGAMNKNGVLVSALLASAGSRISDPNPGALQGIAVTAANNANGTWQYSTDGGQTWLSFGSPSNSSARLLAANAQTRVRFVPNAGFFGSVPNGLTFRAWDQTTGTNGGLADTSINGGSTAYSSATDVAGITVL